MDDKQLAYLYASIGDMQNTIKAIDTKVGLLLVFIGVPITSLNNIFDVLRLLYAEYIGIFWNVMFFFLVGAFFLVWFLSFFAAFKALTSIHNPVEHVVLTKECQGNFFCGGLFKHQFRDIFVRRKTLISLSSIEEMINRVPGSVEQMLAELVFEQMKLAYIRDTKIYRQNWAYTFAIIWLFLGFAGQMAYLLTKKD